MCDGQRAVQCRLSSADSRPGVGTVLGAVIGAGAQVHAASDRRRAVEAVLEQGNQMLFRPHRLEAS